MSRMSTSATYVYGNTVRKTIPAWEVQQPVSEPRKSQQKANHMSVGYVAFLVLAIFAAAFILISYIQMQSQLTGLSKNVTAMEKELNALRDSNNDAYHRIVNSVDMEEVRRIAVEEFGMVYAQEDQIVLYETTSNDYMRQVTVANN